MTGRASLAKFRRGRHVETKCIARYPRRESRGRPTGFLVLRVLILTVRRVKSKT